MITTAAFIKGLATIPGMQAKNQPRNPGRSRQEQVKLAGLLLEHEVLNEIALICMTNAAGSIVYANRLFAETSGYTTSELRGKSYKYFYHPDMPLNQLREMVAAMNSRTVWKGEIKCRKKDGSTYWVMSTIIPVMDDEQQPEKFMCIGHDISRQKKMEEMLEEYRARSFRDLYENVQYAGHIHQSLMPNPEAIKDLFPRSFVNYIPKNVIGGDFFWFTQKLNRKILVLGDSTGHGVSGSLIASLALSNLVQIMEDKNRMNPSDVLAELNRRLGRVTNQNTGTVVTESADTAILDIDTNTRIMTYASGKTRILLLRNGTVMEMQKDRGSVGGANNESIYTDHQLQLQPNDRIFMFSDGYIDQFGGRFDKRLGSKRLRAILEKTAVFDMNTQAMLLREYILHWKGDNNQTDDISMIGVEIE